MPCLNQKQIINKIARGCLLLLPTIFYMSPDANKMSKSYKTVNLFDKFPISKLFTSRSCRFVFGWTQGKNERESKHGNKKIAFFTLENVWFQRKIYPSDVNTMTYASFHNIVRNLVGTSMLNFHPIFAKKWCPQQIGSRHPLIGKRIFISRFQVLFRKLFKIAINLRCTISACAGDNSQGPHTQGMKKAI